MMGKDEAAPPLMTVRQLAQQGDVTVHVVRNYLRRGLLQAATHTEGGYQLFSASELQRLHFIRAAQQLGFTLAEIEEIIRYSLQRHSPCPLVRDIIRRRLDDTRQQLDRLLRSEAHTSEPQSLMRISYAVFCLNKQKTKTHQ